MLKPSPERLGLRGTNEWWEKTIITGLKALGMFAVTLTAGLSLAGGPGGDHRTDPIIDFVDQSSCMSPAKHRSNEVIHGINAASQDVVCGQPTPSPRPPMPPLPELAHNQN